ncbi:MAG TPA: helix-turn-helix transcriptional regulator, partial [Longimicrobiales bacterium]|nr:helix-turn-helix transcriptional regulator [Longimicrobiales bacterium]
SQRERHGSEIMRDVLGLTEGELTLWPATLYGSLEELSERGWIEELPASERPEAASDRQRIYRLTGAGRSALGEETRRLAGVVALARGRLLEET